MFTEHIFLNVAFLRDLSFDKSVARCEASTNAPKAKCFCELFCTGSIRQSGGVAGRAQPSESVCHAALTLPPPAQAVDDT